MVLSRHKAWVFSISGLLIVGNLIYVYVVAPRLRQQGLACPSDASDACGVGKPVQPDPAMGVGYNLCGWCVQRIRARASADAVRIERSTTWLPGEVRIDRLKAY